MSYALRELPTEERPRERLLLGGAESLSTAELLAIVLGSGMRGKSVLQLAQELLGRFGSLEALARATVSELKAVAGLGPAKAVQLQAAFALATRLERTREPPVLVVNGPLAAYQVLREQLENAKEERVCALLLDSRSQVIKLETIAIGTLSEALVHPRELFYPAIRHKAAKIIVAHNHPSGDPTPSDEDFALTGRLVEAGTLLGIPLVDHLVIGSHTYRSIREQPAGTKFFAR